MKRETGGDFHMVMTKGDSVLVSGFSFVGSDDQMREVRAEHGDAMIHHVVTVGGDTTQGGEEAYATIFAQLQAVTRFVPTTIPHHHTSHHPSFSNPNPNPPKHTHTHTHTHTHLGPSSRAI